MEPTLLFPTNASVDRINKKRLDRLKKSGNESLTFQSKTSVISKLNLSDKEKHFIITLLDKSCPADDTLELVIGSQVMLITNKDVEGGLVNGSRGVITSFINGLPIVRFVNGIVMPVVQHTWDLIEEGRYHAFKVQIPLKIAFAMSIHKVQGMSLDLVQMDLGSSIFEYGQTYTALSRVRTLDGLYLIDFDPAKIKTNPKVIEFYTSRKNK